MLEGAHKFQIKMTCFAVGSAGAPECVTHRIQLLYFFSLCGVKGKSTRGRNFIVLVKFFFDSWVTLHAEVSPIKKKKQASSFENVMWRFWS